LCRVAVFACDGVSRIDEPAPGSAKKSKLASAANDRDPNRLQFKIINITKYRNGYQDCYWKKTYLHSTVLFPIFLKIRGADETTTILAAKTIKFTAGNEFKDDVNAV
jgi:hypothetical protein